MDNNLRLLGIARKAGLLAVGGDSSGFAARSGKARAIFSASDASDRSKRRAVEDSAICGAVYTEVPYTKHDLGNVTGRGSPATLAVLDTGLAAVFINRLAESEPERYGKAAECLAKKTRVQAETRKNTAGKRRTAR